MPRTLGVPTLLSGALCVLGLTAKSDDARPRAKSATVRGFVDKLPGTPDEWEARRAQVRQWLEKRLGSSRPLAGAETRLVERKSRDGLFVETLRWHAGHEQATWHVLVPAAHVGRGPAVACFVDRERSWPEAEELARAGYVVLVAHDSRTDRDAVEHLIARRDVDPERLAAWGSRGAVRRAWVVAALDDRVAAVVSADGILGGELSAAGDNALQMRALLALIAPRPHWCLDVRSDVASSIELQQALEFGAGLYRLHDLPTLFRLESAETKRLDARRAAVKWLREEL
jgi:hypothetical protein